MHPPNYSYLKEKDNAIGCLAGLMAGDEKGDSTAIMLKSLKAVTQHKPLHHLHEEYLELFKEGRIYGGVAHKVLNMLTQVGLLKKQQSKLIRIWVA